MPIAQNGAARKTGNKIQNLEQMADTLASLRAAKKKIVHCHGVFDIMHIGHIRHFQQARKFGDILVVTITPDRYVDKGPHRPAFNETLRAETIAALDCVDFVAINRWPTAVDTIRSLRPDFYVKGPDYRDAQSDRTGGISKEEGAVKSVGGKIIFTDDITFSSSRLVNRHLPVFPKELSLYLSRFSRRHSIDGVLRFLESARKLKTLVIGEAIIDEYRYCEAIGKSSKEPTLVVKQLHNEQFAGGILAVGNHVANFCDDVGLISFLGASNSQEKFIRKKLSKNIRSKFLYREEAPTIVKRRYVENYFFTKLLEIYEINDSLMNQRDSDRLCALLERDVPRYDLVIVVDYGHGLLSKEAVSILCRKARFLAINAQSNAGNLGYHTVSRYPRADFVCLTENELRQEARDRRGDLKRLVVNVANNLGFHRLAVTRGKNGCLCYDRKEGFYEVPAFAGQVLDRIGAGDAFLSLAALCVAQKAPMDVVGFIGNAAGAQAVGTVGHRTSIEKISLLKHLESLLK